MLLLADYKGKLTIGPNKCRPCNYDCICKSMTLISGVSISLWFPWGVVHWFFICPCREATFCQQHTAQNPYLLCMWLVVCQEINIRNHFTEIYRCSEIKGDKVSCPRDRAETGCHDTELSRVTRDCCWSHYKAAAPVSPPTQSPPAPAITHRHHALCWSPVRFF